MLLSDFKKRFFTSLSAEYPETEIRSFFYLLTHEYLGLNRLDLALKPETVLNKDEQQQFETALTQLLDHVPVQYIIGEKEFFGLNFKVNPYVLVPRPETEELVEWILKDHKGKSGLRVLDIGTGSGCIATSLAVNLEKAEILAFDISQKALEVARENASLNNAKVKFTRVDILDTPGLGEKFDVIVSNPPYVRDLEKEQMHKNVLKHEPETALYVRDDNALVFYEKIAELAAGNLEAEGKLYFEINQYLAEETKKLVTGFGFETELKKDIFGNFRMLKGIKKT